MTFYNDSNGRLVLNTKIRPSSRSTALMAYDDFLYIDVSAQPEAGKANHELVKFLAKLLKIKQTNIKIVAGETSRTKVLSITGIELNELKDRINNELRHS